MCMYLQAVFFSAAGALRGLHASNVLPAGQLEELQGPLLSAHYAGAPQQVYHSGVYCCVRLHTGCLHLFQNLHNRIPVSLMDSLAHVNTL